MTDRKSRDSAKTPKPPGMRKAPEPAGSHAVIEDWARRVMPALNPIVTRLDALIRDGIPDLQYAIKWQKAYYGRAEQGWLIELVAYDVSVNVVFFGGADFDAPPPLGTVGRSRYVKVRTMEEADAPAIRTWIEQAANVTGWT